MEDVEYTGQVKKLDQELVDQSGMYVYIRVKCHNYFLFLD